MNKGVMFACVVLITALLAPLAAPAQPASAQRWSGPERVYFPETGQYLEDTFIDFWWKYGGVPVFGFPVSPEFEQDGMTVQYFERAVLEVHPDNPPEWQILLRRLGADARTPEHQDHPAFADHQPADPGLYFPETSHNLRFGFREHWEDNGGIRIFGYPLSEEFVEGGFTVQYFERAIFEYHPDNPPEWRILQPLIGSRAAHGDGVDMSPKPHDEDVPIYHPNLFKPDDRVIYLTFDDGPNPTWTPQILNILAEFNAEATFFVLGDAAGAYPALIQRTLDEGHTIANHSYNHASMAGMSFSQFQWQIQATENAVGRANMAPCMRPPYGAMDANTRSYARILGYDVILWDVDPQDWSLPGSGAIANNVINNSGPRSIVLLHDGGGNRQQTVQALRPILQTLSDRGYRFEAICG